jgi:hypothetical protein
MVEPGMTVEALVAAELAELLGATAGWLHFANTGATLAADKRTASARRGKKRN